MIVSMHVASGAAMGALVRSRRRAVLIGPLLHLAGDRVPHQDIPNRRFEIASGAAGVLLLALRRGPFDPATLGAIAASVGAPRRHKARNRTVTHVSQGDNTLGRNRIDTRRSSPRPSSPSPPTATMRAAPLCSASRATLVASPA